MRQINLARLTFLALALSSVALAACGGDGQPEERAFDLKIEHRKLDLVPAVVEVKQNDSVTLRVEADEHGTVHLHGYDVEIGVRPGETATMAFVANATGRFSITFHPGAETGQEEGAEEEKEGHDEHEEEINILSLEVRP